MGAPTFPQRLVRRRSDRRRLALAGLTVALLGLFWALGAGLDRRFAEAEAGVPATEVRDIRARRVCAAVAVYLQATADDWGQRAAIARAHLNRFDAGGVPDCAPMLVRIIEHGINVPRWQASLDAVDAVSKGTYALPLACVRADSVVPSHVKRRGFLPLPGERPARTQCVINGLAFVETRP